MSSFSSFKGILPYASEVFGIYQPLLGWKSSRIVNRYEGFRASLYNELASHALVNARARVEVKMHDAHTRLASSRTVGSAFTVAKLEPLDLDRATAPALATSIDSGVARLIAADIGSKPPPDWSRVITTERIEELLKAFQEIVSNGEISKHPGLADYVDNFSKAFSRTDTQSMLQELFARESRVAGYLLFLAKHTPSSLEAYFFSSPTTALLASATMADPLLNFGVGSYEAILSPIGIIHLYREYFFEFDSFLGPPVGHVWLSPGGTVELIEVATRGNPP